MFRIAHTRQNIITAFGTNTTTTLADISMLKQPAIKARDVEGALQETLIQEEDQRRQQVYSSRGRSEKTAGVFLKRKIREDSRRISQEEDQTSRGRSEKTAGVFLKRKIREDSRCIPQEEDQRRQQAYRIPQEEDQRRSQEEDQRRQ
jgi:neutral trehalase